MRTQLRYPQPTGGHTRKPSMGTNMQISRFYTHKTYTASKAHFLTTGKSIRQSLFHVKSRMELPQQLQHNYPYQLYTNQIDWNSPSNYSVKIYYLIHWTDPYVLLKLVPSDIELPWANSYFFRAWFYTAAWKRSRKRAQSPSWANCTATCMHVTIKWSALNVAAQCLTNIIGSDIPYTSQAGEIVGETN